MVLPTKTRLGKLMSEARARHGHTLAQAAEILRVTPSSIANWEYRGNTPQPILVEALAKYLGMSAEKLDELRIRQRRGR